LITANSPASRPDSSANWEAILWHEFCHVVTLTLTKNKMPRWLSEGISVYEERQQRGVWGEKMKPRYRAMILGSDLTPVSQLSAAFLNPKTPAHLGFAYYESSLVVEYLVERFGLEKMKRILADLAKGVEINEAIAAHAQPIAKIDEEFAERAKALAMATGPKLDWAKPKPEDFASDEAAEKFVAKHPTNFTALNEQAGKFLRARQWDAAKAPLKKLIELYPNQHEEDSAYAELAKVHRELGETEEELAVLNQLAELSPDATDAFARLIELARARSDWTAMQTNAARYAAVNPLQPLPHRAAAEAAEALGKKPAAIAAYRTLLQLDPTDPAEIHYRLARLLRETGDPGAKREVLLALEEAPRFHAALALLLEISDQHSAPHGANKQ
jgi:tetratricopeptide (TPR) repeat protein